MSKLVSLASIVVLAVSCVNCSNSFDRDSLTAPSSLSGTESKGGKNAPVSSLAWSMVTDNNDNGVPNWGDAVTFNVSTAATADPFVDASCYQSGVLVGSFSSWPFVKTMTLSSQSWQSGAADCHATAYYFSGTKRIELATLDFNVAP